MSSPYMEGVSSHHTPGQPSPSDLSILYFNARSILPKLDDLRIEVAAQNPSIVCIVETWLSEDILDQEISIENYDVVRLDRNRHGGGVLMYIHTSLTWEILLRGQNNLEFLSLSIRLSSSVYKHCVSVLYRPPSSPVSFFDNLCTTLQHLSPHFFTSFVLVGDFNINFCNKDHPYFCKLCNILQNFSLSQVVLSPTLTNSNGHASLIDLALVSSKTQLLDCSVIPPLANADHNGLELSLKWKHSDKQVRTAKRTIWRYQDADYRKARQMIEEADWDHLLHENDIDCSATNWHNKFMEIMSACIPQKTLRRRRNVPWLTKNITRHIRKRNTAFQASRKSGKPEHHSKFRKLRNKVVKLMRSAKSSYFQRLNPKDKKQFWKAVKYLNKQQSTIPTLHYQDTAAESNSEKASLLNEFFSTCFNRDIPPLSPADTDHHNVQYDSCPEDLLCTTDEVLFLIESLDSSKANGPDGVSDQMLKATAHSIAPSLTKLFNISISQGRFPECWKTSTVVPIPKSANHKEATNYRPISLLSILSKMLERHFHQYITNHLNDHHPLSNNQWGFQSGKSTVAALLSVTHDWFQALESGQEVCSIFFDLKKAFDSVPHRPLLDKLTCYGLDAHTLSWITSYLTNRKQHVVVGGETSSDAAVLSGVPQGSVLGPLLFLAYIDDVPDSLLSDGSVLNLYADNMLLYKPVRSLEDFRHLQSDIDRISDWVSCNHLTLNSSKCKTMIISRKRNPAQPPQLILNGTPLEQVETFKYLGVLLSSELSWSTHIESICTKARKLIGLLYRRFYGNVNQQTLYNLYTTLVRPYLEYAAPIWDPHLVMDIIKLENVQKFAMKMCSKQWDMGYQDLLELSQLPTLQNRRLYLKLCTLYKIIHGYFYFPPNVFVPQVSRYNSSLPLLNQPLARTNAFQSSFVPSSASIWNHLPHEALTAHSISSFKSFVSPLFL